MADSASDEAAIERVIVGEHVAFWMGDFDTWATYFAHGPDTWYWCHTRTGGAAVRQGWDDIARRARENMDDFNRPSPRFANESTRDGMEIRINGDMAWVTFRQSYPPGGPFSDRKFGPGGLAHNLRILERHKGRWKIALVGQLELGLNSYDGLLLRLDETGRIVWRSEGADEELARQPGLVVKGGTLAFRDRATDRKLRDALRWAKGLDRGLMGFRGAMPIVVDDDAGDGARLWWLVAESGLILFAARNARLTAERLSFAAALYSLSGSQTRLAGLVIEARSIAEMAAETGTSANTVRTQLKRMFEKVGVHSQAALVRVLLSVATPR